jgi:hypothetical protein
MHVALTLPLLLSLELKPKVNAEVVDAAMSDLLLLLFNAVAEAER